MGNTCNRRIFLHGSATVTGLILAGVVPVKSARAAESTLERIRREGFVRIAIANEPPYTEITPDGKVTGAAPEIVRAAMKRLGVPEVVGTVVVYGAMIPGLQAGRFDVVAAGLMMRPNRCAKVLYSQPDVCGTSAFAVKAGNPLGLKSFEDLAANKSAILGVASGSVNAELARKAGVRTEQMAIVPDGPSGIKMLQANRLDAYVLPVLSIKDLLKKTNDPNLEMVAPLEGVDIRCAGAAFRKTDVELRDAYDGALQELKASGEFNQILESFDFPADIALKTTREQLCGGPNLP